MFKEEKRQDFLEFYQVQQIPYTALFFCFQTDLPTELSVEYIVEKL